MMRQFGLTSSTMGLARGDHGDERVAGPGGEEHAEAGSDRSRHERLGEELADERARGWHRSPAAPRSRAGARRRARAAGWRRWRTRRRRAARRARRESAAVRRTDAGRGRIPPRQARARSACPRYLARRSAGSSALVVASSTAGQMRCSAALACSWLRAVPQPAHEVQPGARVLSERSGVLHGRERNGDRQARARPPRRRSRAARRRQS